MQPTDPLKEAFKKPPDSSNPGVYWYLMDGKLDQLLIEAGDIENTKPTAVTVFLLVQAFMNQWSKQGPSHHCAIGVGHIADKIDKLGHILGMEVVKIC